MKRWIAILALAASSWGLVGCSDPNKPRTDAEGKVIKAPEVPPNGV
jgi:hypothetical protein